MDILFIFLFCIVGIFALMMIAALFVKREFFIRREVVIGRPVAEVFEYARHLRNQDAFSKWVMTDPKMAKHFRGQDGTVGFVYAWDGNKQAGKGEQEIIGIKEGSLVDIEVRFERPFKSTARTPITMERISEHQTKVMWGMEGRNKYPLNLMHALIAGILEKDMDQSLQNLKNNLEQKQAINEKVQHMN